jgi:hypothetical protein
VCHRELIQLFLYIGKIFKSNIQMTDNMCGKEPFTNLVDHVFLVLSMDSVPNQVPNDICHDEPSDYYLH